MQNVTVQCPECSLRIVDTEHPDVVYERDGNGNVLCPNCKLPTKPIGLGAVVAAEDAFAHVNRELVKDLPPAETVETLTKRLHEIEHAHSRVISAKSTLEDAREAAKEAKKHFDDEVETFLSLTRRMTSLVDTAVATPLFTKEAEAAAQASDETDESSPAEALYDALMDAGYMAATVVTIDSWTDEQRAQAAEWARLGGTVDTLPVFLQVLAEQTETATA